jgi:hypothetical protein
MYAQRTATLAVDKAKSGATGLKRRNVTIDDASAEKLRAYGDGDLSLGVRRAAKLVSK